MRRPPLPAYLLPVWDRTAGATDAELEAGFRFLAVAVPPAVGAGLALVVGAWLTTH